MVRSPYWLELGKVLAIASLWLIICLTVLSARLSPLLLGLCFLVGIFLRSEPLVQLILGSRPRVSFDDSVFYSNSFRLHGLVLKGHIDSAQDYQAVDALVLMAPISLALDNINKVMYMVLYSKTRRNLLERKEAAFLQFSQIFPEARILTGHELKEFYNQFTSSSDPEVNTPSNIPIPVALDSLEVFSAKAPGFISRDLRGIIVLPYIESRQKSSEGRIQDPEDFDDFLNSETWAVRQPYLLLDSVAFYRLGPHNEIQSTLPSQVAAELLERFSLFLPLKGSGTEDAATCAATLAQILEMLENPPAATPPLMQEHQETPSSPSGVRGQEEISSPEVIQTSLEDLSTPIREPNNLGTSIEEKSTILPANSENNDDQIRNNAFCTELCQLQGLSLPSDILLDLCRSFHQQGLRMLEDSNIRGQLERAKLVGIDDLVVKARELCKGLPATQVLCLLNAFANNEESAFDLRELNDLLSVLKLTLPLWTSEDTKKEGSFPEKASSCAYCHLKGVSSEVCTRISSYLDHLVGALVYRLMDNPQALSRVERLELGRRIVEELRGQDIKIVFPCLVRAVSSQLNLPSSEEDLWLMAFDDNSPVQYSQNPASMTGRS
ncbi:MAG: hypothetical protein ACFFB3_08880 [Candidatus Hodarchaeota archaeon]